MGNIAENLLRDLKNQNADPHLIEDVSAILAQYETMKIDRWNEAIYACRETIVDHFGGNIEVCEEIDRLLIPRKEIASCDNC